MTIVQVWIITIVSVAMVPSVLFHCLLDVSFVVVLHQLIMVSVIFQHPCAEVIDVNISYHYPIFLAFSVVKPFDTPLYINFILDQESFFTAIRNINWSSVTSLCNVDEAFNLFSALFLKGVEECTKMVKCKKYKYPKNQWLSKGVLKSMREKENFC